MSNILLIAALFALATLANCQNCTPFGTRLQYGQHLRDPLSSNIVTISFNTFDECPDSFLRLLTSSGFQQTNCTPILLTMSPAMDFYKANIHRCELTRQVTYNKNFHYMVYGYSADSPDDPVAGMAEYVEVNMPDPRNHNGGMNVMVVADWGPSYTTGMIPIHEEFRKVRANKKIDLLVIAGDIAYNLDTRSGQNYLEYLQFAEQILSQVPMAIIAGNHENYSDDDKLLLNSTFLLYNASLSHVTGFPFGDCYFLLYDPYLVLYGNGDDTALELVKTQLAKGQELGLFIIPVSHYPIICNGENIRCYSQGQELYPYHEAMMDAGVVLHIGAHAHEYNRIYPYYRNKTFIPSPSPYRDDEQYIISIVEGVGGSNTDIVIKMDIVYDYTASYTENQTGFGVLSINANNQIGFRQYSTVRGLVDMMVVEKVRDRKVKRVVEHWKHDVSLPEEREGKIMEVRAEDEEKGKQDKFGLLKWINEIRNALQGNNILLSE